MSVIDVWFNEKSLIKDVVVDGQKVKIKKLTVGDVEKGLLGTDLIQKGLFDPSLTLKQVKDLPIDIASQLKDHIKEWNNLIEDEESEGN